MEQYKHLMLQMNLFYHDVTKDQQELKASVVEEGQVPPLSSAPLLGLD